MSIRLVHMDSLSVEAAVRKAPNGDLVLLCTCGGACEPAPENRVYLFRSADGGQTWSEKQAICPEDGWARYQSCLTVIGDRMYAFVSRHNGRFVDWRNELYTSDDSGYTWIKHDPPFVPENGFVRDPVRMSNGALLFPFHAYPVTRAQEDDCRKRNVIICESKIPYVDNGVCIGDFSAGFRTLTAFRQPAEILPLWGGGKWRWSWSENTVVEAEAGRLIMLYRVDRADWLWRADSFDFGETWGKPYQTDIPNPNNKPQLIQGNGGEMLLLNTPNNRPDFYLKRRFPLEVWVSTDGLKTWNKKIRVSDFPGAYSYPNGFVDDDGRLKLAFEFNRHDVYFADVEL